MHERAVVAVETLLNAGESVVYSSQNVREFWNVRTRPIENNGLGLTTLDVAREVEEIQASLSFVADNEEVYVAWRRLVQQHEVTGAQVHDANLVAIMIVRNIDRLLTFNPNHFRRYNSIAILEP